MATPASALAPAQMNDPEIRRQAVHRLFDEGKFLGRYPANLIDSRPCRKWTKARSAWGTQVWTCRGEELHYHLALFDDATQRDQTLSAEFRSCSFPISKHKTLFKTGYTGPEDDGQGFLGDGPSVRQERSRKRNEGDAEDASCASNSEGTSWAEECDEDLISISDSDDDDDMGVAKLGCKGVAKLGTRGAFASGTMAPATPPPPLSSAPPAAVSAQPPVLVAEPPVATSPVPADADGELTTPASRMRAALATRAQHKVTDSARPRPIDVATPQKLSYAISVEAVQEAPAELRRLAKSGLLDVRGF